MVNRACLGLSWAAIALALTSFAQDPPQPPAGNELRAVQEKTALTDDDRQVIRRAIDHRLADVVAGTAGQAISQLRDDAKGSNAFREAYAGAIVDAVGQAYKTAKLVPATQLIALLGSMNEAVTQRVLIEALTDKRPAVRTAAAVGLRNLHAKLAQLGGAYFTDTLNALKDAGKAETSTVALKAIYLAMNFAEGGAASPDPKANVAAVLEVLDERAGKQYAAGVIKAEGADTAGIEAVIALKSGLSDAERDRFLIAVGRIMSRSVTIYANELAGAKGSLTGAVIDRRNAYEQLIEECERILADQIKPKTVPALAKAMQSSEGSSKSTDMKNQMKEWAKILEEKFNQKFFSEADAASGETP